MTGPEHYKEAERLLTEHEYESSADALAAAQVHATLALAAATVDMSDIDRVNVGHKAEWTGALR